LKSVLFSVNHPPVSTATLAPGISLCELVRLRGAAAANNNSKPTADLGTLLLPAAPLPPDSVAGVTPTAPPPSTVVAANGGGSGGSEGAILRGLVEPLPASALKGLIKQEGQSQV